MIMFLIKLGSKGSLFWCNGQKNEVKKLTYYLHLGQTHIPLSLLLSPYHHQGTYGNE